MPPHSIDAPPPDRPDGPARAHSGGERPAPGAPEGCIVRTRVRYCECDPMGVVHHAAYVPWLEMGRTELLRQSGVSYAQLERDGVLMVIVRLEVTYRRPARYDDVVEIRTRLAGSSRVKLEHEYEVVVVEQGGHGPRGEDRTDATCVVAKTTLACVDRDGRVRALPEWLARR